MATRALARMAVARERRRAIIFSYGFALLTYASASGYRHSYPTLTERLGFARSFGTNGAVRLFYGVPHDLLSVGGFTAWRAGGFLAIVAGVWGALAGVRASRGEEEAGRTEIVLAAGAGRRDPYIAALAALAAGVGILWAATWVGLLASRLPAGESALLALGTVSPAPVFGALGLLAGQVFPDRRRGTELAAGVLGVAFLARVVADTSGALAALRWATPLGWSEELRAFAGARPAVLLLPALATVLLAAAGGAIQIRRDVGRGIVSARDASRARLGLLGSPTALAFRSERGSLTAWVLGAGAFAFVVGLLSTSFTSADLSARIRRELARVGGGSITTPAGALGFYFLFFVLVTALFSCAQLAATRREEAEGRLETLFAQTTGREGWLAGRLALAVGGAAAIAFAVAVLAWAGATAESAHVSLWRLLEAGANCLPVTLLFLGLGALAFALVPRASGGLVYGFVGFSFAWELVGGLLGAPTWTRDLSPFHHVGLVPGAPLKGGAALVMLALGGLAAAAAVRILRGRDLVGD